MNSAACGSSWKVTWPSTSREGGASGTQHHRRQLDALLIAARGRQFDAGVVWKFDCVGRSLKHLLDSSEESHILGGETSEDFWLRRTEEWQREEQQILMATQGLEEIEPEEC
jgi:hypothetical protein